MDAITPDQCKWPGLVNPAAIWRRHRAAVLAVASGGCARYVFSHDTAFMLDRKGFPLVHYASENPHHHLIFTNSLMEFRVVLETNPEGDELNILIATGLLRLVDPGDHDSIDRFLRYQDLEIENYSRGTNRLYRFEPAHARFELFSGERTPIVLDTLLARNPFSAAAERRLADGFARMVRDAGSTDAACRLAGVDGHGADLVLNGNIRRVEFTAPASSPAEAEAEIAALFRDGRIIS